MAVRGTYGKWSQTELELALAAFRNGDCGLNECTRMYNVPKATLKRHLENRNIRANEEVKALGRTPFLPKELEDELEQHILRFEERLFGLTISDVRKLAFQIAKRCGIPNWFNNEKGMAGKAWYYNFMARHPRLSLRQPEATSMARARGFNRERVYEFFDLLEELVDQYKLTASRIFNVDESGFTTVQKKPQKIIGLKGKSQIGTISSGERGVNTTIVCCVSASGIYVPPMIIFKRKRMAPELGVGAPTGSLLRISDTGYITSELFVVWLKHFHSTVQSSPEVPVLLLLDGHTTHSKNLEAITFARENGIILLQLPGHTTHRLQPLDVAFFKPLGTYYIQAQEKWLRTNVGLTITPFHVSSLLGEAYGRAASVGVAEGAFRGSGIWPVNRHIFNDNHFAASNALNIESQESEVPEPADSTDSDATDQTNEDNNSALGVASSSARRLRPLADKSRINQQPVASTSHRQGVLVEFSAPSESPRYRDIVEEVSPLPKRVTQGTSNRIQRRNQKAAVLTMSPYQKALAQSKANREKRSAKNLPKPKPKLAPKQSQKIKTKANRGNSWYCNICAETVEISMIQCMRCKVWVHEKCAEVRPGAKRYFCDDCN